MILSIFFLWIVYFFVHIVIILTISAVSAENPPFSLTFLISTEDLYALFQLSVPDVKQSFPIVQIHHRVMFSVKTEYICTGRKRPEKGRDIKMNDALYKIKQPRNNRWNLHLLLFLGLFFFSILFANLRCSDAVFWLGYQTENSLIHFAPEDFSWIAFFRYVLKNRLLLWLIPAAAGYFRKSDLLLPLFSGWLGFSFGFFATTLIRQFGFVSLPLMAGILLPQIIFYALAYILLIRNKIRRSLSYLPKILLLSGIYLAGTLCEYAVNPWLLDKICELIRGLSP